MENKKYKYEVFVKCTTYNQEHYIINAMESFVMQKTTFSFVVAVIDDASTDKTPSIIQSYADKYPDIIKAVLLKENHYSKRIDKNPYIKEWADNARFITVCEGDDYWIDPLKLQKQYDFMTMHPDCSLCGTNALILWDEGIREPTYFKKYYQEGIIPIENIIGNWLFATATLFYKREVFDNYPEWTKKYFFGDMSLILIAAHRGNIGVIPDITAVYRKNLDNHSSITTTLARKMDYVKDQQILMYEDFDKWTDGKYHELIAEHVYKLNYEKLYYYYRQKNRVLPYLMLPIYTLKKKFGI